MFQDLRYALRMLRRTPLFMVIAVTALGLGIGASTAVFSLIDALLWQPIAGVSEPRELVVFERSQAGQFLGDMGYPDFLDYREQLPGFAGVAAEAATRLSFSAAGATDRVAAALVSGNYFATLGVKPTAGRALMDEDERDARPVLVISDALWRRTFGADRNVAGRSVMVNGNPFTVVGVAPPGFRGTRTQLQADLWLPITLQPIAMPRLTPGTLRNRASGWLRVFGRLRPQVSIAAGQSEVSAVASRLARTYPETNRTRTISLAAGLGLDSDDRAEIGRLLGLLLLCVALLQLIACANVANLLLARAAGRRREVAVRLALGARSTRLVRLFLAEGALLAVLAAGAGLLIAPAAAQFAISTNPQAAAMRGVQVQMDSRVLIFAVMLAALSAVLFALAPALGAARTDLIPSLKEGLPGSGRRSRVRGLLVAAQVALSLVLLAGAGTGIATMRRAMRSSPVSAPDEILLGPVDLDVLGYDAAKGAAFYANLLDRVRALPGVASASLGVMIPPEEYFGRRAVFRPGEEPPLRAFQSSEFDYGLWVDDDLIAPGFFQTVEIPLLKGRDFSFQDRAGAPRVGIVNEALAARLWPGRDPIGQQIIAPDFMGPERGPISIVGEVKDAVVRSPAGATTTLQLYLPLWQEYGGRATLIARAPGGSAKLAKALRETVAGIDPHVPLFAVQTMPQHINAALWRQRLAAGLLSVFGALAVGLAAMGLCGVAAHSVAQRTREIGIRMALGAAGQQISAMVVREGALWVAVGAAFGLPAALLGTWAMQKGIPGAKANDPWVLGGTLAALAAVAMLACYLPARRASRVDPVVALRCE